MAPRQLSHPDSAIDLALAIIHSSTTPMLLLRRDFTIVAASNSFCRAFGIDPDRVPERAFRELGTGEWNVPQLDSLLKATASGHGGMEDHEIDLCRAGQAGRQLIINAQKLAYGNEGDVRLLVAISDVTESRSAEKLKDNLLKEKAVLLQEVHHRVANSLQIIASVLMQSARRAQSEEAKGHLHGAHQRLMSIASLQRQLAASQVGEVELRPYLTSLCESIGAAMIRDHNQLSLGINVDDTVANADISVSLGLIITELVINALKHAFPEDRTGRIKVDYHSYGLNWTLSVTDNGVGMPAAGNFKPGLGTNIVQALSAQLHAVIKVSDVHPGTAVYVTHTQLAVVANDGVSATGPI